MAASRSKEEATASRGVESVARALDLLDALAERERGLVELAGATGQKVPTAHRLLATLVKAGYVRRTTAGRYALGVGMVRLGAAASSETDAFQTAVRPYVDRVQRVARVTTNLLLREGATPILIDQRLAPEASEAWLKIGTKVPAHATASGKAILAFGEPKILERLLKAAPLKPYTARTITQPRRLQVELSMIRERGFSIGYHEFAERTTGIAAPIFDADGVVVGTLSVSLVDRRRPRAEEITALGELIGCAAIEASGELGYHGPSRWVRETDLV